MRTRISASRRRTHQIMANPGFGDTVITQGDVQIIVPQCAIKKKNGAMKQAVGARLMDLAQLSVTEATLLNRVYGVEVTRR